MHVGARQWVGTGDERGSGMGGNAGVGMAYSIGTEVAGSDGVYGDLTRIVVNPVARTVTHLVVEPKHRVGLGRLVPVQLVVEGSTDPLEIRCTQKEFDALEHAEETQFFPAGAAESSAGSAGDPSGGLGGGGLGGAVFWPYYGLGMGAGGMGAGNAAVPYTYDSLPLGEVAVRRGDQVHAQDGDIGRVEGLVIEPRGHGVTHVLLQEGHLWGRRQVAIPITAVTGVQDGIRLSLTKEQVKDLPTLELDPPAIDAPPLT